MGAYAPKGDTYPRNTSKNHAYGHPDARFPRVFWGELRSEDLFGVCSRNAARYAPARALTGPCWLSFPALSLQIEH